MRQFVVFAFGSLLFAQDPTPAPVPVPAAAMPIALGASGLHMQLPAGFVPLDKPPASVLFQAVSEGKQGFRANLNVTAGPRALPAHLDPAAIRPDLVDAYRKLFTDFEFVEDGTLPVLGREAYWISSRFTQGELRLRNFQVLVPASKPCWCTFTMRDDAYTALLPELRTAIATLQQDGLGAPPVAAPAYRMDGEVLVVEELGFRFAPPKGWLPSPAEPGFVLQCIGKSTHGFAPNVLVATAPAAKELDDKAVRKDLEGGLRSMWKEVSIDHVSQLQIGGKRALLEASYKSPGGRLTMFHCYLPAEPQSFVLTYTVLSASAAKFRPLVEASVSSIALQRPAAKAGG